MARVQLEDRVRRAIHVAISETDVLRVLHDAVGDAIGDRGQVRFVPLRHLDVIPDWSEHPDDCVAFRREGPVVTVRSDAFDACAHLRPSSPPVSGVCRAVATAEERFGVVQWHGPTDRPLDDVTIGSVESIVDLVAMRLAVLRVGSRADAPRTDPLTGLLNRNSLNRAVRDLVGALVPFSFAICDLDDFTQYNDDHGHDLGDRALRLFAQVLSAAVRPGDVVGRIDHDVFGVAFPATSAIDAAQALERVREALALAGGDVQRFTVSFGVSDSNQADSIEGIVETAELAAAIAKASGTNRVVVAGEETNGV